MKVLPGSVAQLYQLPREQHIVALADLFHELWRERLNGMGRCVVGIPVDRKWNPLDPHDPVLQAAEAVLEAGGLPRLLYLEGPTPREQLQPVGGLLLPGGSDIDPALYGQEPEGTRMERVDREQDEFELELVKLALEARIPILGLCRGAQLLNIAEGGQLRQQLDNHQQPTHQDPVHTVELAEGSLLEDALSGARAVNSRHHQAVSELAPGYRVTAVAPDGTIEAFEALEPPFRVGCEFHPEEEREKVPQLNAVFGALIRAAGCRRAAGAEE